MIDRRQFLASAGAMPGYFAAPRDRRNVLFIALDDLNDWIGCLGGHPDVKTPNMDRLAARGVLFTNAHCAAPLCNPSRASLMTGVRPSTSGVYQNNQPMRRSRVLAGAVSLPQYLRNHGYSVTGGGKIYHGGYPDPQSWDGYFPSQQENQPPNPDPPNKPANGIPNAAHFDWSPVDVRMDEMGDYKTSEWVRASLARRHDKPFFLACGIFRPHLPWYVPRRFFDMYPADKITLPDVKENDLDDVPPAGRRMAKPDGDHAQVIKHGQWRKAVQGYLASISFADEIVGRVLDGLDAGPNAQDTSIVLWSDHGWHLGEKLHWRKFALWEEATHNVLMVSSPWATKPKSVCGRTVSLSDVYPTVLDLCGVPMKAGLEGRSLSPLLSNPRAEWNHPAVTTYGQNNHSVRTERWRYIRYADGSEELYDRSADPMEWTNLAAKSGHEQTIALLRQSLPAVNEPPSPAAKVAPGIHD
jgi:arylsulfatase A-like enzyme